MSELELSPDQLSAIKDYLVRINPYRNGMVVGQAALEISKKFGLHPFVIMENAFRAMDSDTYLLAVPFSGEMSKDFTAKLPHSGDREYQYYLWACVNGLDEAREKMAEVETDPETNLRELTQAGMLVPKQGSQISQIIQSPNN